MKLRRAYKRNRLKCERVKYTVLGGEKDNGEYCTGYYTDGKTLAPGRGMAEYIYGGISTVQRVEYFPIIDCVVIIRYDGSVYGWQDFRSGSSFRLLFSVRKFYPSVFEFYFENKKPSAAIVSGDRMVIVQASTYTWKTIAYSVKGACWHMGRIFAVDTDEDYVLRWSSTDICDWTPSALGGGYIRLNPSRGALHCVVTLGDKLLVYRERGIDVIKAFGDPRHFSVVPQSSGTVLEPLLETACAVCGDKFYFCSADKVYCYDGNSVEQLKLPDCMKAKNYGKGKGFDGRYVHFSCESETYGVCMLELDVKMGRYSFFSPGKTLVWRMPFGFVSWDNFTVYAESDEQSDVDFKWRSRRITPRGAGAKTLKKIYVESTGDVDITVRSDGVERTFNGSGEIPVDMSGSDFVFELAGRCSINLLEGEWEVRT